MKAFANKSGLNEEQEEIINEITELSAGMKKMSLSIDRELAEQRQRMVVISDQVEANISGIGHIHNKLSPLLGTTLLSDTCTIILLVLCALSLIIAILI